MTDILSSKLMNTKFDDLPYDGNSPEQLPPFASEYNKSLDKEIKEKETYLNSLEKQIEENNFRVNQMRDHLKSIQTEFLNTQFFSNSKKKEIDTEDHLKQIADRETGRIKSDIEKIKIQAEEITGKVTTIQNSTFKVQSKLNEYEQQYRMNHEQLQQWALAKKQKEEDHFTLEKYSRLDEAKIKELNLQTEKLNKELKNKQSSLESEVTETRAAQIELDKTEEEFKNLHRERTQLLSQLDSTLTAMKSRDDSIQKAEELLTDVKSEISQKQDVLNERKKFLESEQENNREVEKKISAADRILAKLRTEYGISQQSITAYQDDLETIKNTLAKDSSTLEMKKSEIQQYNREIESKLKRKARTQQNYEKTKQNLELHFQHTDDLEARAKQLDMYYKQEESRFNRAEKELTELKNHIFKESQELFKLRQEGQNYISEIGGAKAADKNLQAKIHRLDSESLKQQELVYNQEYQLQQLERKIARAQGERTNEEKQILTSKIKDLTTELDKQNEQYNLLVHQQKKIVEDVRAANRKLEHYKLEREQLVNKISNLNLENENSARSLKLLLKRKEELLLSENFVRLDVKRLRDLLYMRADEVYGLENRKYQLKLTMEERKQEISVHKNLLRVELRTSEEERHERAKDLAERLIKIDKLKKKYQLLLLQISPEGDEEEKSQAYYIIKAAQQKEELQQEKENLEELILKAEKEIQGLENSLKAFNALNQRLHIQKTRGGMTAADFQESSELQQKFDSVHQLLQGKLAKAKLLEQETVTMMQNLDKIQHENSLYSTQIAVLETKRLQMSKELIEQKQKVQRAQLQLQKIIKGYKNKKQLADAEEIFIEKDLKLQELKQQNTLSLYCLGQLALNNTPIYSRLEELVVNFGFKLPSRPPSAGSIRSSLSSIPSPTQTPIPHTSSSPSNTNKGTNYSPKTVAIAFPGSKVSSTKPSSQPNSQPTSRQSSRPSSASRFPKIPVKSIVSPTSSKPGSASSTTKFPPTSPIYKR